MKNQIREYLEKAFENVASTGQIQELKEELYINLCERYDDYLSAGQTEQEAYQNVIDGIGDIQELRELMCGKDTGLPAVREPEAAPGESKKADFANVSEISVDWLCGEVRLLKSKDALVHVVEIAAPGFPDRLYFQARFDSGKLVIKDPRQKFSVGFFGLGWLLFHRASELEIYLPDVLLNRLKVSNVSGSIRSEFARAADFRADTVSGSIRVSGEFRESRAESISGKIEFTPYGESCKVSSVSGAIELSGNVSNLRADNTSAKIIATMDGMPREVQLANVAGNVSLAIPENDGFTLKVDKLSGRFFSDFALMEKGERRFYRSGAAKISLSTVSGNCSLLRREAL